MRPGRFVGRLPPHTRIISVSRQYFINRLTGRNLKSVLLLVTARVSSPADKQLNLLLKLEIGPAHRPAVT